MPQKDKEVSQISLKVKVLKSYSEKIKGLIGTTKLYPVYFETRFGIHTFGMLKPIDVFILDSNDKVVVIKKSLSPNNVFFWNPKYSRVVETPVDSVNIDTGDQVELDGY